MPRQSIDRKQQAHIDWIRAKLEQSERSGFTSDTKEQILKQSKKLLPRLLIS